MNIPKKNPTKVKIQDLEEKISIAMQGMKACNIWMAERLDYFAERLIAAEKHIGIYKEEEPDDKINKES